MQKASRNWQQRRSKRNNETYNLQRKTHSIHVGLPIGRGIRTGDYFVEVPTRLPRRPKFVLDWNYFFFCTKMICELNLGSLRTVTKFLFKLFFFFFLSFFLENVTLGNKHAHEPIKTDLSTQSVASWNSYFHPPFHSHNRCYEICSVAIFI